MVSKIAASFRSDVKIGTNVACWAWLAELVVLNKGASCPPLLLAGNWVNLYAGNQVYTLIG